MSDQTKPTWNNLEHTIKNEWIKSTVEFYPEGVFKTPAEAEEAAKVEYEQSEDLHPEVYEPIMEEENEDWS